MTTFFRFASATALLASASMAAVPAMAADLHLPAASHAEATSGTFNAGDAVAHDYRRWHRHRDRIDAGDVIGGLLAVGVVAAIATSISNSSKQRDQRYRDYPDNSYPDQRYPEYRAPQPAPRYDSGNGLSRAVDACTGAVSRDGAVGSVDMANRDGNGWAVEGRLRNGDPFTCRVGPDGRIDGIDYGNRGAVNDQQWSNERYAQAWNQVDRDQNQAPQAMPAYPGGPVGDEASQDDGRYTTAQQGDFGG